MEEEAAETTEMNVSRPVFATNQLQEEDDIMVDVDISPPPGPAASPVDVDPDPLSDVEFRVGGRRKKKTIFFRAMSVFM